MECSYLLIEPGRRICRHMVEQGLDGELDDFDVTNYCKGNPNYCFFFRFYNNRTQVIEQPEENESNVSTVPLTSIVLKEPKRLEEPSSKQSDRMLKLKRFFHRIT